MREIDIVAAKPPLGQHRRNVRRQRARALARRIDHHAREPRRQRQAAQRMAFLGDAAVVERAEFGEQRARLGERAPRRRIEERERFRRRAPGGEIEHKAREIGGEDFRPRVGLERGGLRLIPKPIRDARLGAPGTAAALVGGGARDAHGFEPRQPDIRLVARHAREAANRPRCARPRW